MSRFAPRVNRVKGISDKRQIPRLGKVRLGLKVKKGDKEYPTETDYFVCPDEIKQVYGEKPKKLEIMFPINDPLAIFPQAYTYYGKTTGVKCKGDGEIAWRWHEACDGTCESHEGLWHMRKCPCDLLSTPEKRGECSLRGHLMFVVPKVSMGGVYQLDTGSYHSTVAVNSGIDYVRGLIEVATNEDRFALIPLILQRVPQQTGGGSSGSVRTHYTLKLTCDITLNQLAAMKTSTSLPSYAQYALPEPEDENPVLDPPDIVDSEPLRPNAPLRQEAPPNTEAPPHTDEQIPPPDEPFEPDRRLATDKQKKMLWAKLKSELSLNDECAKAFIHETIGEKPSSGMLKDEVSTLLDKIDTATKMGNIPCPNLDGSDIPRYFCKNLCPHLSGCPNEGEII